VVDMRNYAEISNIFHYFGGLLNGYQERLSPVLTYVGKTFKY